MDNATPQKIDIRKNLERIARGFAFQLDQLEQYLQHPKTKGTRDEVKSFLETRLAPSIEFLDLLFKRKWHVLVNLPEGSDSFQIDLSNEQLAYLRTTKEVEGSTFLDLLNNYYGWFLYKQSEKFGREHVQVADEEGNIIPENKRKRSAPIIIPRKSKSRRKQKASRRRGRK